MKYRRGARTCYPEKAQAELGEIEKKLTVVEAEAELTGNSAATAAAAVVEAEDPIEPKVVDKAVKVVRVVG